MYTNEDLNYAIERGIFSEKAVNEFRVELSSIKNLPIVDEENFRLIGGFNDIFVVIACALMLFSTLWAVRIIDESLGLFVFSILAWGLAEFFVLKRKMALPAIVLLLSFVGGIFSLCLSLFGELSEITFVIAAGISAVAAYLHWKRFNVPITVAAGTAAIVGFIVSSVLSVHPEAEAWILAIVFVCGVVAFIYAMYWDSSDRSRTTRRSDVAFWLHLLSAPLIIHPIFSNLGIFDGNESMGSMIMVVFLYLLMTFISVAIDRRAFMVSSMIYVIYAISNVLEVYGGVNYSFALTGVIIGSALLLLSAFWHSTRIKIVNILPSSIQKYIPESS
jgi:uncharacterized membrane protein YfcA